MIEESFDISLALRLMLAVTALHACVTSMQHWTSRYRFEEEGILSWNVSQLYVESLGPVAPLAKRVLRPPRFSLLMLGRFFTGGALLVLAALGHTPPLLIFVLFLTNLAIAFRHMAGLTGAFQMETVILVGLFLATLFPEGSIVQVAALLFIAVQAVLSYVVAGVSKLVSDLWREGHALRGIFATEIWGDKYIYGIVDKYPRLDLVGCWVVILFECLFPLVLLVDSEWTFGIFAVGLLFHAFNAAFMGLNTFVIIFPASYPAVYYANRLLHQVAL